MNHAFVSSRSNLPIHKVFLSVQAIVADVFKGILHTEFSGDYILIFFSDKSINEHPILQIWPCSVRKLEMRKGTSYLSSWVQCVIQNELAIKFKGKMSDEGVSKSWEPDPNLRFTSYKQYFDFVYEHVDNVDFKNMIWENEKAILINLIKDIPSWIIN